MKATEHCFHATLFVVVHKKENMVLTFESVEGIPSVIIKLRLLNSIFQCYYSATHSGSAWMKSLYNQSKESEKYFPVVLFIILWFYILSPWMKSKNVTTQVKATMYLAILSCNVSIGTQGGWNSQTGRFSSDSYTHVGVPGSRDTSGDSSGRRPRRRSREQTMFKISVFCGPWTESHDKFLDTKYTI